MIAVEVRQKGLCTFRKHLVRFLPVVGPCDLGESCKTRKQHMLYLLEIGYILGPEVSLHTENPFLLMKHYAVERIQPVHLTH